LKKWASARPRETKEVDFLSKSEYQRLYMSDDETEPPTGGGPQPGPLSPSPTLADKEIVKLMLGAPGTCVVSDEELDAAIAFGDSEVQRRIGYYMPHPSDSDYPSFQTASAQFAVFMINNKFPALAKNAQSAWLSAVAICDSILQLNMSVDSPANVELVTSGDYETFPLNPDAIYRPATKRSRTGGGSMVSLGDVI
jgi:hypothetical protein